MKKQLGFTSMERLVVVGFLVSAIGAGGWVWNIVKLFSATFDPITGVLIMRVIGVFFPPLGAVMGFL